VITGLCLKLRPPPILYWTLPLLLFPYLWNNPICQERGGTIYIYPSVSVIIVLVVGLLVYNANVLEGVGFLYYLCYILLICVGGLSDCSLGKCYILLSMCHCISSIEFFMYASRVFVISIQNWTNVNEILSIPSPQSLWWCPIIQYHIWPIRMVSSNQRVENTRNYVRTYGDILFRLRTIIPEYLHYAHQHSKKIILLAVYQVLFALGLLYEWVKHMDSARYSRDETIDYTSLLVLAIYRVRYLLSHI